MMYLDESGCVVWDIGDSRGKKCTAALDKVLLDCCSLIKLTQRCPSMSNSQATMIPHCHC